jgi:hypothetical protein
MFTVRTLQGVGVFDVRPCERAPQRLCDPLERFVRFLPAAREIVHGAGDADAPYSAACLFRRDEDDRLGVEVAADLGREPQVECAVASNDSDEWSAMPRVGSCLLQCPDDIPEELHGEGIVGRKRTVIPLTSPSGIQSQG